MLQFGGLINPDRTTDLHGVIVIAGETGATVLVAQPGTTRSSCADTDGDGVGGVVLLESVYRNVRSGEPVPVAIAPIGEDIDHRGTYEWTVRIGEKSVTVKGRAFYLVRRR